jgi:hypothetical protein
MAETAENRLEEGKKRLADIERRIGPYMPKIKVRDGARRTEWRSDKVAVKTRPTSKKK